MIAWHDPAASKEATAPKVHTIIMSLHIRVSHKKIEFFLFDSIFIRVTKKVESFYYQKIVPVLEKVIVFENRSIRQNFSFSPFVTPGLFFGSKNLQLFLVPPKNRPKQKNSIFSGTPYSTCIILILP